MPSQLALAIAEALTFRNIPGVGNLLSINQAVVASRIDQVILHGDLRDAVNEPPVNETGFSSSAPLLAYGVMMPDAPQWHIARYDTVIKGWRVDTRMLVMVTHWKPLPDAPRAKG